MPREARTIVDVILGEMAAGDFEDAVAIASVIENRARELGVHAEDIVSAPNEFGAFGRALPPGAEKHRDLAKKAWAEVQAFGPVHGGKFYATPAAVENLPRGFERVGKTKGHVYFDDPQRRSIRTAIGFLMPKDDVPNVPSTSIPTPTPAPRADMAIPYTPTPVQTVSPAQQAIDRVAAPGLGLAALTARNIDLTPPSTATRNKAVSPEIGGIVAEAVSRLGPDYGFAATSGAQTPLGMPGPRTGSVRHDIDPATGFGNAIDGTLTRNGVAVSPGQDRQAYMDVMTNLAEAGAQGLGHYSWGLHTDVVSPAAWGPTESRRSLDPGFGLAIEQGRALSGLNGAYPTPSPAPRNPFSATPVAAAPLGRVEQANLPSPAAQRYASMPNATFNKQGYLTSPSPTPAQLGFLGAASIAPPAPSQPREAVAKAMAAPKSALLSPAPLGPLQTLTPAAPPSMVSPVTPTPVSPVQVQPVQPVTPAVAQPAQVQRVTPAQPSYSMATPNRDPVMDRYGWSREDLDKAKTATKNADIAGMIAGGLLGGVVVGGPIGMALGAKLGKNIAGRRMDPRQAFLATYQPGYGFPTAPAPMTPAEVANLRAWHGGGRDQSLRDALSDPDSQASQAARGELGPGLY